MPELIPYRVRPIRYDDLEQLLQWRNSPRVAQEMLGDHKISWEEHTAWFSRIVSEQPMRHLVFCHGEQPLGYVGFSEWDEKNHRCSVSSYLGNTADAPLDAGLFLDYLGLEYIFSYTDVHKVWSYVFASNVRAYKLNLLLGYRQEGLLREHFWRNGQPEDVYVIALLRQEWPGVKRAIMDLYGGGGDE